MSSGNNVPDKVETIKRTELLSRQESVNDVTCQRVLLYVKTVGVSGPRNFVGGGLVPLNRQR